MKRTIEKLLESISGKGLNGIYSDNRIINDKGDQSEEILLRKSVADKSYNNYLAEVGKHHSIAVMDNEIDRFLEKIPENGLILDIGGCWGWHWRRLAEKRPDVIVIIIDFIGENLFHAQKLLGSLVGSQIFLMKADATDLPFVFSEYFTGFEGIWSVQTLQHIPNCAKAIKEVERVLRKGGVFINYSLHKTPLIRLIYFLFRKNFHTKGQILGLFYLERANKKQIGEIGNIFKQQVHKRYTECLFHPDLRFTGAGVKGSISASIDSVLADLPWCSFWIARQQSFEVIK